MSTLDFTEHGVHLRLRATTISPNSEPAYVIAVFQSGRYGYRYAAYERPGQQ